MTKSELVQLMADKNPHLYKHEVQLLVDCILEEISASLERGDRVELRGLGSFFLTQRKSRVGRNPRTGTEVPVAQKQVPRFRISRMLLNRLNAQSPVAD